MSKNKDIEYKDKDLIKIKDKDKSIKVGKHDMLSRTGSKWGDVSKCPMDASHFPVSWALTGVSGVVQYKLALAIGILVSCWP